MCRLFVVCLFFISVILSLTSSTVSKEMEAPTFTLHPDVDKLECKQDAEWGVRITSTYDGVLIVGFNENYGYFPSAGIFEKPAKMPSDGKWWVCFMTIFDSPWKVLYVFKPRQSALLARPNTARFLFLSIPFTCSHMAAWILETFWMSYKAERNCP